MKSFLLWSLPLGRVAGIPIQVHWSWFVVALLRIYYPLAGIEYEFPLWYAVEYVGLFGLVLLHELGHALACLSVKGIVKQIVLWPLGGLALVVPPPRPLRVLWTIAAGPLVNVILTPVLLGMAVAVRLVDNPAYHDLDTCLVILFSFNVVLLIFNLLPVYPLDGGQILHALLWLVIGQRWSLTITSFIGIAAGTAMFFADPGLGVIGAFIVFGALGGMIRADQLARPGKGALLDSMVHLEHRDWEAAKEECSAAIAQLEDDQADLTASYLVRGIAHLATGDVEAACADQDQAVALLPHPHTYFARGITGLAAGQFQPAVDDLSVVLQGRPEDSAAYRLRAVAHYELGDYQAAWEDAHEALRRDPQDVLALLARGCSALRLDRKAEASRDWEAAQSIDAASFGRVDEQGSLRLEPADFLNELMQDIPRVHRELILRPKTAEESEADAVRYVIWWIGVRLTLFPNNPKLLTDRAAFNARLGKSEEALQDLSRAVEIDPNYFNAYLIRADLFASLAEPEKALEDLEQALRINPELLEALWLRARIHFELGQAEAAIADCSEAIRIAPERTRAYNERGTKYLSLKKFDLAVADFRKGLELDPHEAFCRNNLAWVAATCPDPRFRNGPQALEFATQACELTDWKIPALLSTLAAAHAECGDYQAALDWQQKLMQLPDVSERLQKYHRALECYRLERPYREE